MFAPSLVLAAHKPRRAPMLPDNSPSESSTPPVCKVSLVHDAAAPASSAGLGREPLNPLRLTDGIANAGCRRAASYAVRHVASGAVGLAVWGGLGAVGGLWLAACMLGACFAVVDVTPRLVPYIGQEGVDILNDGMLFGALANVPLPQVLGKYGRRLLTQPLQTTVFAMAVAVGVAGVGAYGSAWPKGAARQWLAALQHSVGALGALSLLGVGAASVGARIGLCSLSWAVYAYHGLLGALLIFSAGAAWADLLELHEPYSPQDLAAGRGHKKRSALFEEVALICRLHGLARL